MAIIMMCGKEEAHLPNVCTVTDYPGHEITRIYHDYNCPHCKDSNFISEKGPQCSDRCHYHEPLYMKTTHKGCVLSTYEINGYDDSDFVAIVWDKEKKSLEHITYASTRGWTYPNGATVDATPEVLEEATKFWQNQIFNLFLRQEKESAKKPQLNKRVKIVGGRKIKHGLEGIISWMGNDKFRPGHKRLRITFDDGSQEFTSDVNVEILNPEKYVPDEETIRKRAEQNAPGNWRFRDVAIGAYYNTR